MNSITTRCFLLLVFFSPANWIVAETYDLVIYGGSSAGIAAAVQAKRMGASVVVIEPSNRVGGLTTGGLGQTDIGNKHVIGGIAREFYHDIYLHYRKPGSWKWQEMPAGNFRGTGQTVTSDDEQTQWTFEPSAALTVFQNWIDRDQIEVVYNEQLDRRGESKSVDRGDGYHVAVPGTVAKGVQKTDSRITAITMQSGRVFQGRMFLDATYEGDLMAAAGVGYTVGREGKAIYGEDLNGVQVKQARHHNFVAGVDPYVKPGDPSSGLLKWLGSDGPGPEGSSDHRLQAYCFRMCMTDHPENRIPFLKPDDYDESWYELLFRNYEAGYNSIPWINSSMPNRKTDTNNRDGFSTDFIGQNYQWPEGSYEQREQLRLEHLRYQQGLMWSLANHPRIPEQVRKQVSRWGMTRDEFTEGQGWQNQIYVREGRRMISPVVMTQHHCQRRTLAEHSVGMGAYNMDSHHVQRYVNDAGHAKNEGDVQVGVPPYPIDFHSIVPEQQECDNLLVVVALGASHIAFGSIRMEPVFMILGQSGATVAMQAIDQQTAVQQIDQLQLQQRLLADKQVLQFDPPPRSPARNQKVAVKDLEGVVVDDPDAKKTGGWVATILPAGVGESYLHDNAESNSLATATFELRANQDGKFAVQIASWPNPNRSSKTLVSVAAEGFKAEHRVDQRKTPPIDGLWIPLDTLQLKKDAWVRVSISNAGADGHVIVDAARLIQQQ